MNKLIKIAHPGKQHFLVFVKNEPPFPQTCSKCTKRVSRGYYKCEDSTWPLCEYYLHKECVELKDLPQKLYPLHPQHTLAFHSSFPYVKSFVCSFCSTTRKTRRFYQCSEEQCNFYLDEACERDFSILRLQLLEPFKIQHFFHDHENHHLSPCRKYSFSGDKINRCHGCDRSDDEFMGYKCTVCDFSLHTECSQVPKEVELPHAHQHPLVLCQTDTTNYKVWIPSCTVCGNLTGEFSFRCTQCHTFSLDLSCYLKFKENLNTVKHEAHEHPLAFCYWNSSGGEVRCYACNIDCKFDYFRCFTCNFNIHPDCLALPVTVDYDDHIHPLTLTASFKGDSISNTYYCDICETRRLPDHGIYLCEECPFIAHFQCALSLSKDEYKDKSWSRNKVEGSPPHTSPKEEDTILTNEKETLEIFDQLNVEIEKLREVIDQLITKKRDGEQLTEKIQEFDGAHTNTEDMLRQLKLSVRGN